MPGSISDRSHGAAVFRVPRASTVDLIAIELRNAIYSGALAVGSPIGEVEISSQLGVSRSPLREATQRLVQEGLLTATPGRGLRVSIIRADHVADLYEARFAVESHALRLLTRERDSGSIDILAGQLATLEQISAGTDAREIGDADLAFHRRLVELSGNARLARYMATLVVETRIASFSMPEGYAVRRDVSPTYRQIIDCLRSGDAEAAGAALRTQFDEAVARLCGTLRPEVNVETVEQSPTQEPAPLEPLSVSDREA